MSNNQNKGVKITPKMVLSYTSKTFFYYLTFQFKKAAELDIEYNKKIETEKSLQENVEVSNDETLKNQKRLEKLTNSTNRIEKLKEFVKHSKHTIYETQISDILYITSQIHYKYNEDVDLNIYKLEQFHTYHTDPFIKLIDEAFSDIKNIKIEKVYTINDLIPISKIYWPYDSIEDDTDKKINTIDNDIFKLFKLAQDKLLSLRDTLVITPATNYDTTESILDSYKHMHFFKQCIYNDMKNEAYIYIGKITERNKLIYVCFINKKQNKLVQYNVLTDFPRVILLKK